MALRLRNPLASLLVVGIHRAQGLLLLLPDAPMLLTPV
jgi:hypothetical protein